MDPQLSSRLCHALTGADVALPVCESDNDFLARLALAGWTTERLQVHRAAVAAAGNPWPHPVPLAWLREYGPARWAAHLGRLIQELGLDGEHTVRSTERPLSIDERRLLADVPPHHGA